MQRRQWRHRRPGDGRERGGRDAVGRRPRRGESVPPYLSRGRRPPGRALAFFVRDLLLIGVLLVVVTHLMALAIFLGTFGWKVTLLYAGAGVLLGTVLGAALGRLGLERYIGKWVRKAGGEPGAASTIPVMEAVVAKGVPLGTALAFMMGVVGLSLPEALMLGKVMRPRLLATFFGSVAVSIVLVGYGFNLLL